MAEAAGWKADRNNANRDYALGLARGFAGALIFAFPLIMTMEMWWIGFYVEPYRLLLFLLTGLGLQVGLAYFSGFQPARDMTDALIGGVTAFGIGCLGSVAVLWLLGVLDQMQGWRGAAGMVAIQAVPAGIGAVAARQQLGGAPDEQTKEDRAGYPAQLFLMAAGAVFLAFNVAPTEEMVLITFRMGPWQILLLMAVSLLLLHALVYTVGFAGQEEPADEGFWATFFTYTLAGYGLALAISAYVLWTFGRTDDASIPMVAMMTVVLAFPGALGAGLARLVV
ncbi:TIGR02587 family membrane protein [Teichococcus oryzae]|uniref:TIGR02587 family membrane protein n=1 Tax=Teichococcus oryzae TaxID=1608942 RepID=A0A5B2TGF2_9PROT|nr:TIGR02587 family membrane protein [Pseudoroseomonas oryzae]KAA2213065.1 TIGR02587 family membrane protein [Pseudoroseomonas oryzae]